MLWKWAACWIVPEWSHNEHSAQIKRETLLLVHLGMAMWTVPSACLLGTWAPKCLSFGRPGMSALGVDWRMVFLLLEVCAYLVWQVLPDSFLEWACTLAAHSSPNYLFLILAFLSSSCGFNLSLMHKRFNHLLILPLIMSTFILWNGCWNLHRWMDDRQRVAKSSLG